MVSVFLLQELASARKHMEENQESKWLGAASTAMCASGVVPALCVLAYDTCIPLVAECLMLIETSHCYQQLLSEPQLPWQMNMLLVSYALLLVAGVTQGTLFFLC
jgi:hypothetical protein